MASTLGIVLGVLIPILIIIVVIVAIVLYLMYRKRQRRRRNFKEVSFKDNPALTGKFPESPRTSAIHHVNLEYQNNGFVTRKLSENESETSFCVEIIPSDQMEDVIDSNQKEKQNIYNQNSKENIGDSEHDNTTFKNCDETVSEKNNKTTSFEQNNSVQPIDDTKRPTSENKSEENDSLEVKHRLSVEQKDVLQQNIDIDKSKEVRHSSSKGSDSDTANTNKRKSCDKLKDECESRNETANIDIINKKTSIEDSDMEDIPLQ